MTKTHEQIPLLQIPLLAKLGIFYQCDKCDSLVYRWSFYHAMDEVIEAASIEDGKLICGTCRDKRLKGKE